MYYSLPCLYLIYCWSTVICPSVVFHAVRFHASGSLGSSDVDVRPEFTQADAIRVSALLKLDWNTLTPAKLAQIHRAVTRKPVLTLANALWALSVLGIVVSVVPACWYIYPFVEPLVIALAGVQLVWEILAYAVCVLLINTAYHSNYPTLIATTGALLAIPCLYLTSCVHGVSFDAWQVYAFAISGFVPLALVFDSQLIGFFSVAAAFGLVGFEVIPVGGGFLLGAEDTRTSEVVAVTSLLTVMVAVVTRHIGWLAVFRSGMFVLGTVTYGVCGLILSSPFYDKSKWMNVIYPVCLCVILMIGNVTEATGLSTSSLVFGLLFVIEKFVQVFRGASWMFLFIASCGLWKLMWVAHSNDHLHQGCCRAQ